MSSDSGHDPVVYAVVLNWNGWMLTEQCLHSLAELTDPQPRVLVVDNGSTDGSESKINEAFPGVSVIQTGRNLGFAGGINAGIRRALSEHADFVWALNNDTRVEPGALRALLAKARDDRIGIVGSVLHSAAEPGRIQAWGGGSIGRWLGLTELWTAPRHGSLDYLTGACMLLRRELLEEVGLFDEGFFLYFEDVDLCLLATARGWRLAVAEDSVVYHRGGATAPDAARSVDADRRLVRASGRFLGKHMGRRIVVAAPVRLATMIQRRLRERHASRIPALTREFIAGVASGLRDRRDSARRGG